MQEKEEIEGLDARPGLEVAEDYPLDAVMVRNETRTIGEVVKRIEKDRYILDPDFQRAFVWKEDKQSKLIESCVMRIPLPVFYVAENADGRVVVVDGLQRLYTFKRFIQGELRLQGLGQKHPLADGTFQDLPLHLQERIEDTQLTLYILDKDAPDRARLDIFERVNSGVPLTRQQMRNALYGGRGTKWLAAAAEDKLFKEVTGHSLRSDTMRDREAINRYCAFELLGWQNYRGDMDAFLAEALQQMNHSSQADLGAMKERFRGSLNRNKKLFGRHAFRKSLIVGNNNAPRSILNISLFDVCSTYFAHISDQLLQLKAESILRAIKNLLANNEFLNCITYSTNSTLQVRGRFLMCETALKEFQS